MEHLEARLLLSSYSVIISEFMADNKTTLKDVDNEYSDWIELQNVTTSPVNLVDWQLRDSASVWTFPAVTLPAGGRLVVFASGKNRRDPSQQLHTNFKLDKGGEPLYLLSPGGTVAFSYDPYPPQLTDISS